MSNHMDKYEVSDVRSLDSRPTIGLLAEVGRSPYHRALWKGFIDAASELDVNLIWYWNDVLRASEDSMQRNIFHDLITVERVEGLLISGTLGNYVTTAEFRSFIDHYRPMPMVGITQTPGLPCVVVDNGVGIRDTVAHLIEVHGYRRIAFICGSENNEEAAVRYRAYVDVLEEHGLPLAPDLVAPGTFIYQAGLDAVHLLLDERKVKFEAVVAANDWMALGALRALEDRGIRVPDDVALAGFDDTREAMASNPPLTTVRQPIQQLGYAGIRLMLKLLAGEQAPEQTMLPTRLVVRQSCGCAGSMIVHTPVGPLVEKSEPLNKVVVAQREEILAEMAQVMGKALSPFSDWAEQLLTAFSDEIVFKSATDKPDVKIDLQGPFLSTLHNILQQTRVTGSQFHDWQKVISVMRRYILPHIADVATLARIGALFDQARVVIDSIGQRNWTLLEVENLQLNTVLGYLRNELATNVEMGRLADVLTHRLPQLGFSDFYLSLYEGEVHFTPWSRLMLAFEGGKRVEMDAAEQRFLSHRLTPDELIPQKQRYTWIVEPLFFERNQFGYLILKVGPRDAEIYGSLTSLISGSMQDSLLIRQLEVHRVQMLTAADVSRVASGVLDLDELIQQVVNLVQERFGLYYAGLFLIEGEEAVLRAGTGEAGRQMLAEGHQLKISGDSTVSRCLTERRACIALDVGKEAVRFENSLLPETRSEIALLLMSRGESIGALTVHSTQEAAFGDEDIVVFQTMADQLANAIMNARLYVEAQRAYAEVEQQVRNRTAELEQEIAQREQAQRESARLQQEVIEAQKRAIQELSTPVIPVMDAPGGAGGIIVMPLIGSIDSMRARDITRSLLAGISQHRAKVVILDVTGVGIMDTGIVNHLNKTIQAARLKGAHTIITGVSDAVAEAIVDLGIDWSGVTTLSNLQTGLIAALDKLGLHIEGRVK
jgi:DNA-binding LacI/PurR family transcriptional regulator/anti-anti-sigma regulatory factor/putative methionine-R-sulfoxide reductase with GAF domain